MTTTLADRLNVAGTGRFQSGPPAAPASSVNPPSEKQVAFLRKLLAEREGNHAAEAIRSVLNDEREAGKLDRKVVSTAIDSLLKIKVPRKGVAPETSGPVIKTGFYTLVEGAEGHRTFKVTYQPSDADFAPGATIISFLSGPDNEHDYTSFGFVKSGPTLAVWRRFAGSEALVADAQAFLADPDAALVAQRCARCGHKLTTPESVERQLGPDCAALGW